MDVPEDLCRLHAVVVIDNDSDQTAQPIVREFQRRFACPLIYACLPERNIAQARNVGVQKALQTEPDFVAFTDDDCVASETWLAALTRAADAFQADVVWGQSRHEFDPRAPEWVRRGRFFGYPARATGTIMQIAESGNVMIRATWLQATPEPFDPQFGRSGGSDSVLFMRLRRRGAKIVWAEDAIVVEKVPLTRATTKWLVQRAYRMGNCGVFSQRAALPLIQWLPERVIKAGGHIAYGSICVLFGCFRGRAAVLRGIRSVALGIGIITALCGHKYLEYREVHGE